MKPFPVLRVTCWSLLTVCGAAGLSFARVFFPEWSETAPQIAAAAGQLLPLAALMILACAVENCLPRKTADTRPAEKTSPAFTRLHRA